MSSPRYRSNSRSSSYSRRKRRSPSYDRHDSHDRYERSDRHDRRHRHERHRDRSPRRSPRRGIPNPPKGHPDFNPGNNLYVSNLQLDITEDNLKDAFCKFGEIMDARIVRDPISKDSRRFGFVTFNEVADAEEAIKGMDGYELNGNCIRVEKARRSKPHDATPGSYYGPAGASSKYKSRRRRSPSY